jgi:GNAT superfamily N-acetyltransferase
LQILSIRRIVVKIASKGWVKRWVIGAGGFIGEVSLAQASYCEASTFSRKGVRCVVLTNLYVHPLRRGNNWADSLMRQAVAYADRHQLDLVLTVKPHGPHPRASRRALEEFYLKFGFEAGPLASMVRRCS